MLVGIATSNNLQREWFRISCVMGNADGSRCPAPFAFLNVGAVHPIDSSGNYWSGFLLALRKLNKETSVPNSTHLLNEVLAVLRDGAKFYAQAAQRVDQPDLRAVFLEIAALKEKQAIDLSTSVTVRGEEPNKDGTLAGASRRLFTQILGSIGSTDPSYIGQLKEHEERLLSTFDRCLAEEDISDGTKQLLEKHRPDSKFLHDQMDALNASCKG